MKGTTYMMGILQVRAYRQLQAYVQGILAGFDLNPTQWSMLGLVYEAPNGLRVIDIAAKLSVEPSLVTMLSRSLLHRDILEKVAHPEDSRARLLSLTVKGKEMVGEVEELLDGKLQLLLSGVSPSETRAYRKVLETIVRNSLTLQPTHPDDAGNTQKGGG